MAPRQSARSRHPDPWPGASKTGPRQRGATSESSSTPPTHAYCSALSSLRNSSRSLRSRSRRQNHTIRVGAAHPGHLQDGTDRKKPIQAEGDEEHDKQPECRPAGLVGGSVGRERRLGGRAGHRRLRNSRGADALGFGRWRDGRARGAEEVDQRRLARPAVALAGMILFQSLAS